jgi:hypothetical protein
VALRTLLGVKLSPAQARGKRRTLYREQFPALSLRTRQVLEKHQRKT